MTFDEFIKKYTGKPVDFDGVYPNQCMDLAHFYVYEVLGVKDKAVLSAPSAYQVFTGFKWGDLFTKVENKPTNVPKKGDIVVWGTGVGTHGHIAIFVDGNANKFNSFDANWPTDTLPHIQDHTYKGVLGWLSFKNKPSETELLQEKINTLEAKVEDLRDSRNRWKSDYIALEESSTKEIQDLIVHRDTILKEMGEVKTKNEALEKAIMTNKTPLSAYTIKERVDSIVKSLFIGGDI